MQAPKNTKTKHKFVLTSAYYQTPIVVATAFALGWVGTKLVTHLMYAYNYAVTIPNQLFSGLDWDKGWKALYDSGVPKMIVIGEFVGILVLLGFLTLITGLAGKKTEEREKVRDAKLDELLSKLDVLHLICPNGCNITQAGSNFCGQCGSRLIRR